jgi:N-acetylglucosaminyldiphosphoundecaprenol N-acetyl-beta-D-mannosaminyltransferase
MEPSPHPALHDQVVNAPLPDPPVVRIEGLPFAALRMREIANLIISRHSEGRGGWVVTPNIDILRRWMKDASFRTLVGGNETLFTADGAPIIWLSYMLGTPLPERVSGSDLFAELASEAAINGKSIYLLGGNPGIAEIAAKILVEKFPALCIAGCHAPPFGFERDPDEVEKIRQLLSASRPDIVFVGLGSPKQEQVIASLRELLPFSWWLGVGVSFSFVAGDIKRAPIWMRKAGLEWFYRVLQEPKRLFKRYFFVGIPFALGLFVRNLIRRIGFSSTR